VAPWIRREPLRLKQYSQLAEAAYTGSIYQCIGKNFPEEGFGPGKSVPTWVWVAKILCSFGPMHAQFDIGRHDEAAGPRVGIRAAEHLHNATRQGETAGLAQPDEHKPGVSAGRESA
jgi:hypothetical protein